ncbi:MAG: PAS domain-containing protein [Bryobacteraceae bacterium]
MTGETMAGGPALQDLKAFEEVGVLIVSSGGVVLHANDTFLEEFGWKRDVIEGSPMIRIIPPSYRDSHNLAFARFLSRGSGSILGQPLSLPVLTGSGQSRLAELCIFAERVRDEEWRFGATIQPC